MADIKCISGAVHDEAGPISSLVPLTERGRKWLTETLGADLECNFVGGKDAAIIETENVGLAIDCAERDGLIVDQ